MTAADRDCYEELLDFATCPSCQKITTDIRLLPCMDRCCLPCLQQRWQLSHDNSGHEMDCSSCGQTFAVPPEGLEHLPSNSYTRAVVTARPVLSGGTPPSCSVCGDKTMPPPAAKLKYCKECRQYLCERCAGVHRNIRLTRAHHVVESARRQCFVVDCDTEMCSRHPAKNLQVFCGDCSSVCCLACLREVHRAHNWNDLQQVSDVFRQKLDDDVRTVNKAAHRCDELLQRLSNTEVTLTQHMDTVKRQAYSHRDQLIAAIDHEIALLNDYLSQVQNTNLQTISQSRDRIKKQKRILQCFERFCRSIIETGTVHEVIHVHNSVHGREEHELPLLQAACNDEIPRLKFTPVQVYDFLPRQQQQLIGSVRPADENAVQCPTWNELQSQLQQVLEQVVQLQQQAEDNQQSISRLEQQLVDKNDLVEKISKDLEEKNSLVVQLEQRRSDMASDIKEKDNAMNSLKEELQQRDGMLDEHKMQLESVSQQLLQTEQNHQSQLREYQLKLEKTALDLQESERGEARCRVGVDELSVRVQQLEESLMHSVDIQQQMETELEDARQQISEQSMIIEQVPPTAVYGVAVLNQRLYVARAWSTLIEVYDVTTYSPLGKLSIPSLLDVTDMTASQHHQCLYVADSDQRAIHAVDLTATSRPELDQKNSPEQVTELQQQANDNQWSIPRLEQRLENRKDLLDKASKELEEKNSLAVELHERRLNMAADIGQKKNTINSLKEELQLESLSQQLLQTEQNYQSQLDQYSYPFLQSYSQTYPHPKSHSYPRPNESVWSLPHKPYGVSVSPSGHVIVSFSEESTVGIFSAAGVQQREIWVTDPRVVKLRHAVLLTTGQLVICHGSLQHHDTVGLSVIDTEGQTVASTENNTSNPQLGWTTHVATDHQRGGFIYAVDYSNKRVIQLNSDLTYITDIVGQEQGIRSPRSICLDSAGRRLYVAEASGNVHVFGLQ